MALIRFHDGTSQQVSATTGKRIWEVLQGEVEPTEREVLVVERVARVYLSWHNAPVSYVEAHLSVIAGQVVNLWMVESQSGLNGLRMAQTPIVASGPDPTLPELVAFSRKWGLVDAAGRPTDLARAYM